MTTWVLPPWWPVSLNCPALNAVRFDRMSDPIATAARFSAASSSSIRNPVDVFLRPAVASDVEVIEALIEAVHAELAPERGGATWLGSEARAVPLRPSIERDIAADDVHVRVSGIDDVVLGVAVTRLREMHDANQVAYIGELVVDPEARGVGIGVDLLNDAVDWARQRGAVGIESTALPGQRATKNFFEAAGMKARLLTVYAPLDADPDAEGLGAESVHPDDFDDHPR